MKRFFIITILSFVLVSFESGFSQIGPLMQSENGDVYLVLNQEIKLTKEEVTLYHHPLGVWLAEFNFSFLNLRNEKKNLLVGFPSGFNIYEFDGKLYNRNFENFKIFINSNEIRDVNYLIKCTNYVKHTGINWSTSENLKYGLLNTWNMQFEPDENIHVRIVFNFTVSKLPPIYNYNLKESWYKEQMDWLKSDFSSIKENNYKLPLSIGSFWAFYPDSIVITAYKATDWLKIKSKADWIEKNKYITRYEYCEPVGFYSPPEIKLESLTEKQLSALSPSDLILLRNSFFAKYGRAFEVKWLKKFFMKQEWYSENIKYQNWQLMKWDIENIKKIKKFEKNN